MTFVDPQLRDCFVSELGPMRRETVLRTGPTRARVTAPTYGGVIMTRDVEVVATADGYRCVRQMLPDGTPWSAWVPDELVVPD